MPFSTKLSADRAEVGDPFTSTEIDAVAANAAIRVVQSSAPLSAASWRRLDEELLARRPDIQLRVYGFYGNTCDLSFVGQMKHVRRFAADSLQRATGVESIAALQRLEALSLGVFDLDSFEVLEHVSDGLKEIFLSATRSKKPDLRPVRRFRGLRTLYLEGQQRSIDVIADLAALEDLTLRSISTPDLSYAAALPRLTSLDLKLGGIKDLTAIARLAALRYLEIWQVRGLADIGVVSELHRLQNLFLQSLPGVKALPPLDRCAELRRIVVQNMRGLRDFSAAERAPALEEFWIVQGDANQPADLAPVLRNRMLRRAAGHFGSDRKNRAFETMVAESGKARFEGTEFAYR
jgi:hypothetical protein